MSIANSTLEAIAQQMGWVVKYTTDGIPSLYAPFYKCKSSDLDASLPEHTHPAFIVNGEEIDRRLIAVYKGSQPVANGAIVSLPNMKPSVNLGADALLEKIKAGGAGFGPKTVADSGLLLLLAKKNGWVPKGNNYYGCDYRDASPWEIGKSVTVDTVRSRHGITYKCLVAHTTALELAPESSPAYWQKVAFIGGLTATTSGDSQNTYNTLTGSGPVSWRLGGVVEGLDDLVGNCYDQDYGYRVVHGEIQILANNNAADPEADLSDDSAAWKAILPNQSDDGYTLVAPGTTGTCKWDYDTNGKVLLNTTINNECTSIDWHSFKTLSRNTDNLPYVPSILRELGIFPCEGDTVTNGTCGYDNRSGEFFPRRGGHCYDTSHAGLGHVDCFSRRGSAFIVYGVRGGFLES